MDRKFLIIPEFESLEESAKLAENYHDQNELGVH